MRSLLMSFLLIISMAVLCNNTCKLKCLFEGLECYKYTLMKSYDITQEAQLSQRDRARFLLLNISVSHSRSFEITLLSRGRV